MIDPSLLYYGSMLLTFILFAMGIVAKAAST